MSSKKELYCYLRVSSKQQLEEGSSIDNQRKAIVELLSKEYQQRWIEQEILDPVSPLQLDQIYR